MARLSKSHRFKIFEDTGIPTPPGDENDPFDDTNKSARVSVTSSAHSSPSKGRRSEAQYDDASEADEDDDDDEDDEAAPRDSLTSVSSFPESTSQRNDADHVPPPASPQKFFTPQIIRPSFRRPESVRRMQMSSPRQSILSYHRSSRSGTPRSEYGRGSPRGRRRITEELTSEEEEETKQDGREHPLVLLHVTLLPIALPWSMESIQELLPSEVLENLLLLRSKVSETVLQRGILVQHPREEYEMLEERLLEALELREERVTKCGHFRGRVSESSQDSDSALGSSESSSDDGELCTTCRHHVRCTAGKKSKWSVKVFAANGLMRSSAWAAAWSEMESVDIEILPWISDEDRRRLDQRREKEESIEKERRELEVDRVREAMKGEMMLLRQEQRGQIEEREDSEPAGAHQDQGVAAISLRTDSQAQPGLKSDASAAHDLPPIYRASQVPLSVLLRNYLFLLAQDPRNVAMFFLSILAIFFAVRSVVPRSDAALAPVDYTTPFDTAQTAHLIPENESVAETEPVSEVGKQDNGAPGVLESVVETISEILADEDEAVFEAGELEAVLPPEDIESSETIQEEVALDDDMVEMTE